MSDTTRVGFAHQPTTQQLRYAGAMLAYLVGGLHLFHPKLGFPRLILLISANPDLLLSDPRPVAFVLSGSALIIGVTVAATGFPTRWLYVLGAVLMLTYLTGYFAWHLSGHGGFLPGREPLYHGLTPLEAVTAHLGSDPWAAVAVGTETTLLAIIVALSRRES